MATFALFVQHECIGTLVISEVLRFCESAVSCGHRIDHIFFYQDAIYSLSKHRVVASDEVNWVSKLENTATMLCIDLLYCTTAADRRGIAELQETFVGAGLAEFAMRIDACDRVIGF